MLEGEELRDAREHFMSIVPALSYKGRPRGASRRECTRVVYEYGGLTSADNGLFKGLAQGATAIRESTAWISERPKRSSRFGSFEFTALEIRFDALLAWLEHESLKGWPDAARKLADPVFTMGWTILSTAGTWCWSDEVSGENSLLTCPRPFLDGYLEATPDVVGSVIEYLFGDGSDFICGSAPPGREPIGPTFLRKAYRYLEPMYGSAATERLEEIVGLVAREAGGNAWQRGLTSRVNKALRSVCLQDALVRRDLAAIWLGEYG